MKKVLSLLLLAGLFMFGGCGGSSKNDDEAKKARIEEMLGKWDATINTGSSKLNNELYFTLTVQMNNGNWAVAYAGDNFTDICIFDEKENVYIAETRYCDETTKEETGEIEAYIFPEIVNGNKIYGVYGIGNEKTEEYSEDYDFEGTRSYTLSAKADNKKSIKKSLKRNGKIELTEAQKEELREVADLIKNK